LNFILQNFIFLQKWITEYHLKSMGIYFICISILGLFYDGCCLLLFLVWYQCHKHLHTLLIQHCNSTFPLSMYQSKQSKIKKWSMSTIKKSFIWNLCHMWKKNPHLYRCTFISTLSWLSIIESKWMMHRLGAYGWLQKTSILFGWKYPILVSIVAFGINFKNTIKYG